MAPAAAANDQTARARVRLQGSSSVAAVGAGARRATGALRFELEPAANERIAPSPAANGQT
eukprot:1403360-Prymnesium_polylepis.1